METGKHHVPGRWAKNMVFFYEYGVYFFSLVKYSIFICVLVREKATEIYI
jgi:hypothetical protein